MIFEKVSDVIFKIGNGSNNKVPIKRHYAYIHENISKKSGNTYFF